MGVFRADPGPARAPRYFFRTTGRLELASKPVCRWGNAGTWSGPVAFPASSKPWILTIFGSGKPVFLRAGRVFGAQPFFVCRPRVPCPLTTPRGGSTRPVEAGAGGVTGLTETTRNGSETARYLENGANPYHQNLVSPRYCTGPGLYQFSAPNSIGDVFQGRCLYEHPEWFHLPTVREVNTGFLTEIHHPMLIMLRFFSYPQRRQC